MILNLLAHRGIYPVDLPQNFEERQINSFLQLFDEWSVCPEFKAGNVTVDGLYVRWSEASNSFSIYDSENGQLLRRFMAHTAGIKGLEILPSRRILSWSWDDTLRVWDVDSASCIVSFEHFEVEGIAVLDDCRVVSWSYWDNGIRLWNIDSGIMLAEMTAHDAGVHAVSLQEDGSLCSHSDDGVVIVWDTTGSIVSTC